MSDRIAVRLEHHTFHVDQPLDLVEELQTDLGEQAVYLLESLSGPDRDCERAFIGVGPVLSIEVTDGRIAVDGNPPIAHAVTQCILRSHSTDDTLRLRSYHHVWDVMRSVIELFDVPQAGDLRMDFGFLTVLSYDAVHYIEDLPRTIASPDRQVADLTFGLYASVLEVDLRTNTGNLTTARSEFWEPVEPGTIAAAAARAAGRQRQVDESAAPACSAPVTAVSQADYLDWVATALGHVRAGDVYQVQLGYDVALPTELQPGEIYRVMRRNNPSPFMGAVPLGDIMLLSASPELHFSLIGREVTMRPIAGTAPRIGDPAADAEAVAYLKAATKEQAEHVMLVDLCRNDLGRIAVVGSTRVPTMMEVESYSHVYHLVSTVTATLDEAYDVFDVIRATFPAGTMTGAPKVRAMEVIESLENSRRGLYAGIFGVIGVAGYANLALTIRSIFCADGIASTRASAGIVADSDPHSEWQETRHKMNAAVSATTGRAFE